MRLIRFQTPVSACLSGSLLVALLALGCSGSEFTAKDKDHGSGEPDGGTGNVAGGGPGGSSDTGGSVQTGGSGPSGGSSGSGGEPGGSGGLGGSGGEAGGSGGLGGSGGEPVGSGGLGGSGGDIGGSGGLGGSAGETGGSGGSPGGSGGALGGSGGALGEELCLNGKDDNGNYLVDCDDPQCQERFTCVPAPPDGWDGVGWLISPQEGCPTDYPTLATFHEEGNLSASPASCDCSCGEPLAECFSKLDCYPNAMCTNSNPISTEVGTSCTAYAAPPASGTGSIGCVASTPYPVGECAPDGQALVASVSWPESARACLRTDGGVCADDRLCVPKPGPDLVGPCIARAGDYPCPNPHYIKTLYYDGSYSDTRGCTACTCGPLEGAVCACDGTGQCAVGIHGDFCSNVFLASVPANGQGCTTFEPAADDAAGAILIGVGLDVSYASCRAADTSPVGEVIPDGLVTLCCME